MFSTAARYYLPTLIMLIALFLPFAKGTDRMNPQIQFPPNRFNVARFDEKSKQMIIEDSIGPLIGNDYVLDVEFAPSGKLYVLLTSGLSTIDLKTKSIESISQRKLFAASELNDLYIDSVGSVYIASNKGLFVSNDSGKTFNLNPISGFESENIHGVIVDAEKNHYLSTESGLLVSTNQGKSYKKTQVDPAEPNSNLNHFYKCFLSPKGVIACTTWHGFVVADKDRMKFRSTNIGSGKWSQISFDTDGRMYLENMSSVYRSDKKLEAFEVLNNELKADKFQSSNCFVDSQDRIFVFGPAGVAARLASSTKFTKLKIADNGTSFGPLSKMLESPDKEIWHISWMTAYGDLPD